MAACHFPVAFTNYSKTKASSKGIKYLHRQTEREKETGVSKERERERDRVQS